MLTRGAGKGPTVASEPQVKMLKEALITYNDDDRNSKNDNKNYLYVLNYSAK